MSHTHLLYHIVFGTKDHSPLISSTWKTELYKYLGGIIRNHKGVPIEINGMPDHTHILARLEPVEALSDFMRELKAGSSKWVRKTHQPKFGWQRRYGAFSVNPAEVDVVINYIANQHEHHKKKTFQNEYRAFLKKYGVEYDEKYIWD